MTENSQRNKESFQYAILDVGSKLTSLMSILLISIALTFEIGFFYGVGKYFFTFFSLTEHILFTIEWIPVAFVYIFSIMLALYMLGEKKVVESDHFTKQHFVYYFILFVLFFLVLLNTIWEREFRALTGAALLAMYALLFPVLIKKLTLFLSDKYRAGALFASAYGLMLMCSFVNGIVIGGAYVIKAGRSERIITKDAQDISARIIRSGDKGVLYFDVQSREIVFSKWDSIESVLSEKIR